MLKNNLLKFKIICLLLLSLFSTSSFSQWDLVAQDLITEWDSQVSEELLDYSLIAAESDEELVCMAKNIYFEAGNQPLSGKIAVGLVTLNRTMSGQFPNTICDVVYQAEYYKNYRGVDVPLRNQCQFSWFCDGKADNPTDSYTWLQSLGVAEEILDYSLIDITEGALWYHADYVNPNWSNYLQRIVTIENHIFYK